MKSDRLTSLTGLVSVIVLFGSAFFAPALAADVALMTTDELKAMIDNEDLVVLDVRRGKDWKSSEFKIKGALRADPGEFATWGQTYAKEQRLVLYCA
jgi:hypothetical protein